MTASVEMTWWTTQSLADDTQQEQEDENPHGSAGRGGSRQTCGSAQCKTSCVSVMLTHLQLLLLSAAASLALSPSLLK